MARNEMTVKQDQEQDQDFNAKAFLTIFTVFMWLCTMTAIVVFFNTFDCEENSQSKS